MSVVTVTSEEARLRWRETIDAAYADKKSVVIERHSKPVAVLLSYEQWQTTLQSLQRLKELELLHEVRQVKTKIANGETSFTSHDELKRLILEQRTQKTETETTETIKAHLVGEDLLVEIEGEQYFIPTGFLPNFHSDYPLPSNAELLLLRTPPAIDHVHVSDSALNVYLTDGRLLVAPLAWYPRLLLATPAERNHYELRGDQQSIYWPTLDEDIDLEALLIGGPSCESAASISRWLQTRHREAV